MAEAMNPGAFYGPGTYAPRAEYLSELVTNAAGNDLLAGEVVRINGNTTVTRAQANVAANATGIVGAMRSATLLGAIGSVANAGRSFVLLEPALVPVAGEALWLSATNAGRATNVMPADPFLPIHLGTIKDTSNYATTGGVIADLTELSLQGVSASDLAAAIATRQPANQTIYDQIFTGPSLTLPNISPEKRYRFTIVLTNNGVEEPCKLQPDGADANCKSWYILANNAPPTSVDLALLLLGDIKVGAPDRTIEAVLFERVNGYSRMRATCYSSVLNDNTAAVGTVGNTSTDYTSLTIWLSATSRTAYIKVIEETPSVPVLPSIGNGVTDTITFADPIFIAASTVVQKTIRALPTTRTKLVSAIQECIIAFAGAGITGVTVSVGSATPGNEAIYVDPLDVTQIAHTESNGGLFNGRDLLPPDADLNLVVTFTASGAMFGNGAVTNLTQGKLWITTYTITPPAGA